MFYYISYSSAIAHLCICSMDLFLPAFSVVNFCIWQKMLSNTGVPSSRLIPSVTPFLLNRLTGRQRQSGLRPIVTLVKVSRFLQPMFSGFLRVTPSPRDPSAASWKMITDEHPSTLNSALEVNFFRLLFQGLHIDLHLFSHDRKMLRY